MASVSRFCSAAPMGPFGVFGPHRKPHMVASVSGWALT
jgi:hypothetical protein